MIGDLNMNKEEINALYKLMFAEYPEIVTPNDIKEMLNISKRHVYRLLADGEIKGRKLGNMYRIPKVNVINYVLLVDQQVDLNP